MKKTMTLCTLVGVATLGLSACRGPPGTGMYLPNSFLPLRDEGAYIIVKPAYDRACIASADWDTDEDLDILACEDDGRVYLYENDGGGNFTKSERPLFAVPSDGACSLDVVDIDNDGDLDVLSGDGEVHLYRNMTK